jgi:hypothetical protein
MGGFRVLAPLTVPRSLQGKPLCRIQIPQASGTYLSLISGMLMQLAAATATKGTHLPISGGAFCQ